jgi:1-acyl-sn-glycerol-3-phosphate acyltransferase
MRRFLQWHGCFSVDREANDLTAFKEAVSVLRGRPEPLLIFPEGDIYHCNDRVTPFRDGAAAIAIAAARRAKHPVVVLPTTIRYRCAGDPTPKMVEDLASIERRILWRPRPDLPVVHRIWAIGNAVLGLKEQEFYGHAKHGPLPCRLRNLADSILKKLEDRHELEAADAPVPQRVKQIRHAILTQLHDQAAHPADQARWRRELDDAFEALQLFSYPGDYLEGDPTIERIAETVDKLEEDVLQRKSASIRCRRDVRVTFGEAIPVPTEKSRTAATELTHRIECEVKRMLQLGWQTQSQVPRAELSQSS